MYHILWKEKYRFENPNKKGDKWVTVKRNLTNKHGQEVDRIDSKEIVLKQSGAENEKTHLMFWGTCMGQTPIKHSNA